MLFRLKVGMDGLGTKGTGSSRDKAPPPRLVMLFPIGPPERLDAEKRRAKQNMEDLEKLHSKEVLSYGFPWLCCLYLGLADQPCVAQHSQCTPLAGEP